MFTSNAKHVIDTIANQAGIEVRAGGHNQHDEQVVRYTYDGVCVRVVYRGWYGEEIIAVERREWRMDGGVWYWARVGKPLAVADAQYGGDRVDVRPYALMGWTAEVLADLVNTKARDEDRARRAS